MVALIGFAHTPFSRVAGLSVQTLMSQVAAEALADAGLEAAEIDAIVIGHFGAGMVRQGFVAGLASGLLPGLQMTAALRVESACASGSAALHQAALAIRAGAARRVLVIGVEVMSEIPTAAVGQALLSASYVEQEWPQPAGFAGLFAQIAACYAERYGDPQDAMALIAAKNHANGACNPLAQYQQRLSAEFCSQVSAANPRVVGLLRRSDCSAISDGAAAVVMAAAGAHPSGQAQIRLRAMAQANDLMPMASRDMSGFAGARRAWQQLLDKAGVTNDELDCVELHDCFTIAELMLYEAMGLTPAGQGRRALDEGWVLQGGRLPVNLSGGLKAKGHPVGATGVSMHVMAARLLLGRYRGDALPNARLAGVFNMGGAAVANYGSILERVQ